MKNITDFIQPTILTIIPTHRCTAQCEDCCFRCTPRIKQELSYEDIIKYIDQALLKFSTIKLGVVSGGECFLLGEKLYKIIAHLKHQGLYTRIVSNGFWGNSYETAHLKLSTLKQLGLDELNLSTGNNHLKFVPLKNIINICKAAVDLNIRVCLSIESHNDDTSAVKDIINAPILSQLIQNKQVLYIKASWMNFTKREINKNCLIKPIKQGCNNILTGITISPYHQLLSCCGLTVENNPFLKAGDVRYNDIEHLYNNQFNDLLKLWLYIDGPLYIYEQIMKQKQIEPEIFPHNCAYCYEIIKDENIGILKYLIRQEYKNIIYKIGIQKYTNNLLHNLQKHLSYEND